MTGQPMIAPPAVPLPATTRTTSTSSSSISSTSTSTSSTSMSTSSLSTPAASSASATSIAYHDPNRYDGSPMNSSTAPPCSSSCAIILPFLVVSAVILLILLAWWLWRRQNKYRRTNPTMPVFPTRSAAIANKSHATDRSSLAGTRSSSIYSTPSTLGGAKYEQLPFGQKPTFVKPRASLAQRFGALFTRRAADGAETGVLYPRGLRGTVKRSGKGAGRVDLEAGTAYKPGHSPTSSVMSGALGHRGEGEGAERGWEMSEVTLNGVGVGVEAEGPGYAGQEGRGGVGRPGEGH